MKKDMECIDVATFSPPYEFARGVCFFILSAMFWAFLYSALGHLSHASGTSLIGFLVGVFGAWAFFAMGAYSIRASRDPEIHFWATPIGLDINTPYDGGLDALFLGYSTKKVKFNWEEIEGFERLTETSSKGVKHIQFVIKLVSGNRYYIMPEFWQEPLEDIAENCSNAYKKLYKKED